MMEWEKGMGKRGAGMVDGIDHHPTVAPTVIKKQVKNDNGAFKIRLKKIPWYIGDWDANHNGGWGYGDGILMGWKGMRAICPNLSAI